MTVTVSGLTISNGNVVGLNSDTNIGGGIMNRGTLTIDSCVVTGNQANVGGGVYNLGVLTILRSTISNNTATEDAGGIANAFGDGASSLRIDGSTISNNVSADQGGGLLNGGSLVSLITNTTISSNTAFQGAGLSNFNNIQLNGVTITANNASSNGGGIRNSGPLLFTNTILAGNTAPVGTDGAGIDFFSVDFNVIGNTSGMELSGAVSHNKTNVDARLGPLVDNGGPTRTHELLHGSPAIDAGFTSTLTDQRGSTRPVDNPAVANVTDGDASDIGAYETPVFEVNSTADTDDAACTLTGTGNGCTLREAINAANTAIGSEVITFKTSLTKSGPATITLLTALAELSNMTIVGPGAGLLTVRRSSAAETPEFRIFTITRNRIVSISGLTISNGRLAGDNGGGVSNSGSLTMTNCNVYGNSVGFPNQNGLGGGVHQEEGSLTLINCNIGGLGPGQPNTSGASGGGVFHSRGTTVMTGGSITGNTAGGIFASLGTVTLNGVTISDNSTGNVGGGVWAGADMKIINCLILNNTAGSFGGGIHATANTPTLVINTTISGNKSLNSGGGGIDQFNGFIELINSTVTNNRSGPSSFGGGIDGGGIILRNTIVAGNFRGSGTIPDDITGLVNSNSSNNLIGDGSRITGITNGSNGNQIGTGASPLDAMLGPLADNGGLTLTHAPLPGSPVLDAGNNASVVNPPFPGPPFTDQRGASFNRIVDGPDANATATVDIGAVEQQVPLAGIADTSTNEDTELIIPFHIGDRSGITSITATSSDKKLVPNDSSHLRLVEAGSTELIIVNPSENLVGTTEITVTVNSTGGSSNRTFVVTVNPVNDAPSFERQRATSSLEDIGAVSVSNFATNLSAGPSDEAGQTLSFQVTNNDNPGLFAAGPAISPSGTLTYTGAPDANGSATITVVLKDNGGTANGGKDTSTPQPFTITITPVNDSPVNILPGIVSVNENSTVTFSTANSTRIATSDVDARNAVVQVALTVNNGVLSLSGTTGLTFVAGDGVSDATMTFKDTIVNINTALNGMVYTPNKGFSGFVNLQITTDDLGASGAGASFPDTDFVTIAVLDGGMLQYPAPIFAVNEDVGNTSVIALRIGGMAGSTSVNFATTNGTATGGTTCGAGVDYISSSGTLSWVDGEQGIKAFSVTICEDANNEELETINLTLSTVTGSGGSRDAGYRGVENHE